eukprot:5025222-Pyramimonas_sp.AAC.2
MMFSVSAVFTRSLLALRSPRTPRGEYAVRHGGMRRPPQGFQHLRGGWSPARVPYEWWPLSIASECRHR